MLDNSKGSSCVQVGVTCRVLAICSESKRHDVYYSGEAHCHNLQQPNLIGFTKNSHNPIWMGWGGGEGRGLCSTQLFKESGFILLVTLPSSRALESSEDSLHTARRQGKRDSWRIQGRIRGHIWKCHTSLLSTSHWPRLIYDRPGQQGPGQCSLVVWPERRGKLDMGEYQQPLLQTFHKRMKLSFENKCVKFEKSQNRVDLQSRFCQRLFIYFTQRCLFSKMFFGPTLLECPSETAQKLFSSQSPWFKPIFKGLTLSII